MKARLHLRWEPAVVCALVYVLGGWMAARLQLDLSIIIIAAVVLLTVAVVLFALGKKALPVLTIAILLLGFIRVAVALPSWYAQPPQYYTGEYSISGVVCETPSAAANSISMVLDDATLDDNSELVGKLLLRVYDLEGTPAEQIYHYPIGTQLTFTVSLEVPAAPAYAGDFDARFQLAIRGISHQCLVSADSLGTIHPTQELEIGFLSRLRERLNRHLITQVGGQSAELMRSLLLGDTTGLQPELRASFSALGLSHVLAVSGLHVGLLILAISWLTRKVRITFVWSTLICIVLVAGYVAMAGFRASLVRAALLWLVVLLLRFKGKDPSKFSVLAVVMLIDLAVRPLDLFDIGFQLSFLAMAGLVLFSGDLVAAFKEKLPKFILYPMAATLSVNLILWPVLAYYFSGVSYLSLLSNIILLPVASMLVWLSFGYAVFMLLLPVSVPVLAGLIRIPFDAFIWLINALGRVGLFTLSTPPGWAIIFYVLVLCLLSRYVVPRPSARFDKCMLIPVGLAVVATACLLIPFGRLAHRNEIQCYGKGNDTAAVILAKGRTEYALVSQEIYGLQQWMECTDHNFRF